MQKQWKLVMFWSLIDCKLDVILERRKKIDNHQSTVFGTVVTEY